MQLIKWTVSLSLLAAVFVSGASMASGLKLSKEMRAMLKQLEVPQENIRKTPIDGLYELQVGTKIFYLSKNGEYLLTGNMIELGTRENLTEKRLGSLRVDAIKGVGKDQQISFKAKKPKHSITVFTDIDCGYCRKLHAEMAAYNKLGISVNYLFYPRTGPGSPSYDKAVSVWCSKNRNQAMTQAKSGEKLSEASCNNPVTTHFQLGNQMGINGTPAIVTETGELMPGYVPPARLIKELDIRKQAAVTARKVSKK